MTTSQLKILLLAGIFSALSVYRLHFDSTAFIWPALDNLPAVCRLLDPDCLKTDFFTNAGSGVTPRMPFVYILSKITYLTDNGIGGGLAVIKALLLALLPIVLTVIMVSAVVKHCSGNHKNSVFAIAVILAPIAILFFHTDFGNVALAVGWWWPLSFDANANSFSVLLAMAGFCFLYRQLNYLSFLLIFIAGIIHPPVAILTAVFVCVLYVDSSNVRANRNLFLYGFLPSILSAISSALTIKLSYHGVVLDAEEFSRIYAWEAHPHHYIPSQFGSSIFWSFIFPAWFVSFGLILLILILYRANNRAWINAAIALSFYILAILAQYLFVELWPVKLMVGAGVSRFTMFGPWFLVIFLIMAIADLVNRKKYFAKPVVSLEKYYDLVEWKYVIAGGVALFLCFCFYSKKSANLDFLTESEKQIIEFVKNTDKDDVFIFPPMWTGNGITGAIIPLLGNRSVFIYKGFPFSEADFREWSKRNDMAYGSVEELRKIPSLWIGGKKDGFYRVLIPNDFVKMGRIYRLDWVVLESKYLDAFSNCNDSYMSDEYTIFSIEELRKCAI